MTILSMEEKMSILTREERDRRWKKIREAMENQGLDCLILWGCFGRFRHFNASLRYLCNFHTEGYMVSPLEKTQHYSDFKEVTPPLGLPITGPGTPTTLREYPKG